MKTAVWHWALLKVSSFRSSLRSVCPPKFNVGDDGPPNELSKEWNTEMKTCALPLGLDAACDLSNCVRLASSFLPSMLPCWMGHVLRVWNKRNYKEDMAELLGVRGLWLGHHSLHAQGGSDSEKTVPKKHLDLVNGQAGASANLSLGPNPVSKFVFSKGTGC